MVSDNDELIANETLPDQPAVKPRKARRPPPWVLPPDQFELSKEIARQLHEPERALIGSVIKVLGMEVARALLAETLAIEAQGGMMLPDNSRRRTAGGVFLALAKQHMTREEQNRLHSLPLAARAKSGQPKGFEWERRQTIIAPLLKRPGSVSSVKAVVMGRPTAITAKPNGVVLTLTQPLKAQPLPRGVPTPADDLVSRYTVYIGAKQWAKVKAALSADENDILVIEGMCAFDESQGGMAVYTTSATTRNLQIQQRQQQQQKP